MKFLSQVGLTKIHLPLSGSENHKIRLYSIPEQTPETLEKIKIAFQNEAMKGRSYKGSINTFNQDIQCLPYLLKSGMCLKLVSIQNKKDLSDLKKLKISFQHQEYLQSWKSAVTFKDSGEYPYALDCYHLCLKIAQDLKSPLWQENAYYELNMSYKSLGKYDTALDYAKKYEEATSQSGDLSKKGRACNLLGIDYFKLGYPHQAAEYHQKDLEIAVKLKDYAVQQMAYNNLGVAYNALENNAKALKCYEKALALHLDSQSSLEKGKTYRGIGEVYRSLGQLSQALENQQIYYEIAEELDDPSEMGQAYGCLGNTYHTMGNYDKAIEFHLKDLEIANDPISKGEIYANLGNAYLNLENHQEALEYYQQDLAIANEFKLQSAQARAHGNIGNVYVALGSYRDAIQSHENHLLIAKQLKDPIQEADAHFNLGNTYQSLGEYYKAIECYRKSLAIIKTMGNLWKEGFIYCNLGITYYLLREFKKALGNHILHWNIAQTFNDQVQQEKVYANLGNVYSKLGNYDTAQKYSLLGLSIAGELNDLSGRSRAYSNLGNIYYAQGDYESAIAYHRQDLAITQHLKDRVEERITHNNLGNIYHKARYYAQAEDHFRKGIEIANALQHEAQRSQWQVTLFENFSILHLGLEKTLLSQGRMQEALEISDARRYRALSFLLSKKLAPDPSSNSTLPLLNFEQMRMLAHKFETTFIVYSLKSKNKIIAWIITPDKLEPLFIPLPPVSLTALIPGNLFDSFPYSNTQYKRPRRGEKQPCELFKEHLANWYTNLIAPLQSHLTLQSDHTLTIIPDGALAYLPFGAFYNQKEDYYLIEKYPITMAPSLQVLALLDQLPKEVCRESLLMGNPTTVDKDTDQLELAEREVCDIIRPMLGLDQNQVFIKENATPTCVLNQAPVAKVIHIACHGIAGQKPLEKPDPNSVFEGLFKLSPDEKHPLGHLHAEEIASMSLKADLVFMSACHLGRGNLKREGSIGPIWSFLGSGAKATIASYWALPEGEATVKMVEAFYHHYLREEPLKLNKAQALQQAILMAMKTERNKPRQWGAFFLSGIIK